jgi:hypothetical protein
MDVIGEIFSALKSRMQDTGLFTKVFGLSKLDSDGTYQHYIGAGQSELVGNFDNERGTVFFLLRSGINIGLSAVASPVPCQRLYQWVIQIRAVAVIQKNQLICDSDTAGFQLAQGMLKEFYGLDNDLKTTIKANLLEIFPGSMDDKLLGIDVGNEYAVAVVDFNIDLTTNIECLPGLCQV